MKPSERDELHDLHGCRHRRVAHHECPANAQSAETLAAPNHRDQDPRSSAWQAATLDADADDQPYPRPR